MKSTFFVFFTMSLKTLSQISYLERMIQFRYPSRTVDHRESVIGARMEASVSVRFENEPAVIIQATTKWLEKDFLQPVSTKNPKISACTKRAFV